MKMKRIVLLGILAGSAIAANAQTFNTLSFSSTIPGVTANFVASGNSYTANLTGFQINANQLTGDIAWVYDFNSSPVPAYSAVTIEIGGDTINGVVNLLGAEKVFDMSGVNPVEVANEVIVGSGSGGAFVESWTITKTINFSQPVTIGQAQKDLLFFDGFNGTGISNVHYIKQTFTPVPEPASMAALGLGVVALIRRRRAAK